MSAQDPIADMLTRIRNAQRAHHAVVDIPASRKKERILSVLQEQGYIDSSDQVVVDGHAVLRVVLRYYRGKPVIKMIKRVSRPGLRVYASAKELPKVENGLGIAIVSTSYGTLTDAEARKQGQGGEVLCFVA